MAAHCKVVAGAILGLLSCQVVLAEANEPLARVLDAMDQFKSVDLAATFSTEIDSSRGDWEIRSSGRIRLKLATAGASYVSYSVDGETSDGERWGLSQEYRIRADGSVIQVMQDPGADSTRVNGQTRMILFSEAIAGLQEVREETIFSHIGDAAIVAWRIGGTPIADMLRGANSLNVVDQGDSIRVSGRTNFGNVELVATAENAWIPTEFELAMGPDHMLHGKSLREHFASAGGIDSMQFLVSSTGYGGKPSSRRPELSIERIVNLKSLVSNSEYANAQVQSFSFSPEYSPNDLAFSAEIPVGRNVDVAGAAYLPHHWDGTDVVASVSALPAAETLPVYRSIRFWSLLIANVLLLGAAAWLFRLNSNSASS